MNEVIKSVMKLLYGGENAAGVVRNGNYYVDQNVFEIALREMLESGNDVLEEYDRLMYMSWDSKNIWRGPGVALMNESDMELFDKAIDNENFWNIYSMFDEQTISNIAYWEENTKQLNKHRESYEYRRKEEFTERLKKEVRERDGNRCTQCSAKITLEVHHLTPLVDGGDNSMSNLTTLCHYHHVIAHKKLKKGGESCAG